jgi:hypothetical protein
MPSDAKKKRDLKKKEQSKSKSVTKKPSQNGSGENGEPVELSAEGTCRFFPHLNS